METTAAKTKTIARIHQDLDGKFYITDDSLSYLTTDGLPSDSRRAAVSLARVLGYTHYLTESNKTRKL